MALSKLGKYERVDVLGHGVSGIVYLAWDTLLKKQVALKEIDLQAADVSRFLEEARVMDRLHHPNIVRVNSVDMIDGRVVIDMEYVKGQNLQELLRQEGRLPVDRALDIAIQTLDALDYAHRMRTVHRDIKPANILLSRTGQVKLVDFGLAEILATNSYAGGAGTYAYMAPEDFEEEHHSDHQSDIWAVGVTLYEMLTGTRPFQPAKPKDPFAWRRALLNESPLPLSAAQGRLDAGRGEPGESNPEPSVSALQAVLDRALARDKRERYATAGEFRDDLIALREQRAPLHTQAQKRPQTEPTRPLFALPSPAREGRAATATMQAVVVTPVKPLAEKTEVANPPARGLRALLPRRRAVPPAVVRVEPETIHFGAVRKGDERAAKVTVRIDGGEGRMTGRVVTMPDWVTVSPTHFRRRKQALTVTARSERVWQTGDYEGNVRLETSGGEVRIPVGIRVLKPRPRFSEVALWLVPLFLAVLLPALTVAWGAPHAQVARFLVPSAALGSGLLAAMLLLVVFAADLGFAEKMACGVLLAVMTMVLGVTVGVSLRTGHTDSLSALLATGVPIGLMLLLQALSRRHWQAWACAIVVLSLLTAGTFAAVLSGRL